MYTIEKEVVNPCNFGIKNLPFNDCYDFNARTDDYKYIHLQNKLLINTVEDFAYDIQNYLDENYYERIRSYTIAAKSLAPINDEKRIAFITIKSIFSSLHKTCTRHKVIKNIANALNDEYICIQLTNKNKNLYDKISCELSSKRIPMHFRIKALLYRFEKEEIFTPIQWTETQKMNIGHVLLELFYKYKFIEKRKVYNRGRTYIYVIPSMKMIEFTENNNTYDDIFYSSAPTTYEPVKWTNVFSGGYNDSLIDEFIRKKDYKYLKKAEREGLENYFNAVNLIQSVGWEINSNILNVAQMILKENIEIAGIPANRNLQTRENPYPYNPDRKLTIQQLKELELWKQECVQINEETIKNRSKRLLVSRIIKIADKYKNESIYFPHNLDFRGRMYPISTELQPQGCDLSKALLRFKDGKKLDDNGVKWLKIHIANVWGLSKKNYKERIKWVDTHIMDMFKYAENPLIYTEWTIADKPFQFLAGCYEMLNFLKDPDNFVSTLPIFADGTCNGLQHYSALLEDEVGGKSVNLICNDMPADIYQDVADCLIKKLEKLNDDRLAQLWLSFGINRKLTKRPVMTLVYGAVKRSCKDYIKEYLLENYNPEIIHQHFEEKGTGPYNTTTQVSNWLGNILWETIEECLPSAIKTMEYIKKITRMAAKKQKLLEWYTPMGMLVNQSYTTYKDAKIYTNIMGNFKCLTYRKDSSKYNKYKQANAICPNFIHSLDASCLMLWILRCNENSIYQISAIHDSFGVLAADMETSQKIIRETFIETYTTYNILEKFIEDITSVLTAEEKENLPEPLKPGSLNLYDIKDSDYFFS